MLDLEEVVTIEREEWRSVARVKFLVSLQCHTDRNWTLQSHEDSVHAPVINLSFVNAS